MHIRITAELAPLLQNSSDAQAIEAIGNLCSASRQGCHLVFFEDEVWEAATSIGEKLSAADRAELRSMRARRSELGGLTHSLSTYINVEQLDGPFRDDGDHVSVPLYHFSSFENVKSATLFTEDLNDHIPMCALVRVGLETSSLRGIEIRCEAAMFGGSGVLRAIDHWTTRQTGMALFIVDSDKSSPQCPRGGTAKLLHSGMKKHGSSYLLTDGYEMNARELENLVPRSVLEELREDDRPHLAETLCTVDWLLQHECDQQLLFADLKKGDTCQNVQKYQQTSDGLTFWPNELITKWLTFRRIDTTCCSPTCDATKCACVLFPHGGEFLSAAGTILQARSARRSHKECSAAQQTELEALARVIIAWCCGSKPRLVI